MCLWPGWLTDKPCRVCRYWQNFLINTTQLSNATRSKLLSTIKTTTMTKPSHMYVTRRGNKQVESSLVWGTVYRWRYFSTGSEQCYVIFTLERGRERETGRELEPIIGEYSDQTWLMCAYFLTVLLLPSTHPQLSQSSLSNHRNHCQHIYLFI